MMNPQIWVANILDSLEDVAKDSITRLSPLLTPIPTAWITGSAVYTYLDMPIPVAVVAGLIVEGLGFAAMHTTMELHSHNQQLTKDDKGKWKRWVAPVWLASMVVVVYFVSVLGLTILLDTIPEMARYALLLFCLLSIGAFVVAGIRNQHKLRVEQMIVRRIYPYTGRMYHEMRQRLLEAMVDHTDDTAVKISKSPTLPHPAQQIVQDCWCGKRCPDGKQPRQWHSVHLRHAHMSEVQGYSSPEAALARLVEKYAELPENVIAPLPDLGQIRGWWEKGQKGGGQYL
jgi:hypothetical protein